MKSPIHKNTAHIDQRPATTIIFLFTRFKISQTISAILSLNEKSSKISLNQRSNQPKEVNQNNSTSRPNQELREITTVRRVVQWMSERQNSRNDDNQQQSNKKGQNGQNVHFWAHSTTLKNQHFSYDTPIAITDSRWSKKAKLNFQITSNNNPVNKAH